MKHESFQHILKHLAYTGGWKKFEKLWNFIINTGGLKKMLPLLELLLSEVKYNSKKQIRLNTQHEMNDIRYGT